MKKIILIGFAFIGLILILSRCSKEPLDSSPKVIWDTKVSYKSAFGSFAPVVSDDRVAIAVDSSVGNFNPSSPVFIFDKNTGQLIKKWADFFKPTLELINFVTKPFQNKTTLAFCTRHNTYMMDLNTGKTAFKQLENSHDGGLRQVVGLGDKLYRHLGNGLYDNDSEDYVMEYNVTTGANRMVYQIKGKEGYQVGLRYLNVSVDKNQDTILVAINNRYHFGLKQAKTALIKYNISKNQLVFEKEWANPESRGTPCPSIIFEHKIYSFLGHKVICSDWETGETIWLKELGGIVVSSNPILANNTLYVNAEDKVLYALNLKTGNDIWKTKSAGTCGDLNYMNGVLYFQGGSDGLLHAVDANSGQYYYKFRCPDEDRSTNFFWQEVSVDPTTNRLYAVGYGAMYCLSAVK